MRLLIGLLTFQPQNLQVVSWILVHSSSCPQGTACWLGLIAKATETTHFYTTGLCDIPTGICILIHDFRLIVSNHLHYFYWLTLRMSVHNSQIAMKLQNTHSPSTQTHIFWARSRSDKSNNVLRRYSRSLYISVDQDGGEARTVAGVLLRAK